MAIANMQVQFDDLFWLFTYLAMAVSVVVFGLMVIFVIKYRDRSGSSEPHDAPILGRLPVTRGHARTAILTVSLSTIILGVLIIGSFGSIDTILSSPAPCNIQISHSITYNCSVLVTGHRFYWDFNYAGFPNRTITGAPACQQAMCIVGVPQGQDIRLNVTSADVFHNFGVIAFKVKADAYPGHVNFIWFNADKAGNYTIQCYELCGSGHATMIATLDVMPLGQFVTWFNNTIVR
jgi:cytochrome c oxidase subunit II